MNRHAVRLFARYAELFGSEQVEVMLPVNARVSDLIAALRVLPGGGSLPDRPFVAVDMVQAAVDDIVRPDAEVALLPPLAGG
jgi:molybdopterin converting factor small subunit